MAEGNNNPTWGVPGFEAVPDFASTVAAAVMGLTWAMEGCGSDEIDAVDAMSDRYADVQKIVSEALADFGKVPAPTPDAGSDLAKLSAAAAPGQWCAHLILEMSPADSDFCDALVNAYRSGRLVEASASQPPGEDLAGQGEPLAAWIRRAIMANLKGEADGVDEAVAVIVSNLKASAPDLAGQGEPVAWAWETCWGNDDGTWEWTFDFERPSEHETRRNIRPLYAAPAPSRPADRAIVDTVRTALIDCGLSMDATEADVHEIAGRIAALLAPPSPNAGDGTQTLYNKLDGDSLDYICEVIGSPAIYNKGKSAMRTWFLARLREAWGIAEKKDAADA